MSFKDELARHRPKMAEWQDFLDRWKLDDRAEANWKKLHAAAKHKGHDLNAQTFIEFILAARWRATRMLDKIIEHEGQVRREFIKYREGLAIEIKLHDSPIELRRFLEGAVARLWDFNKQYYSFDMPVSRQDSNGSRSHKAFIRLVSKEVKSVCKLWLDGVVCELTDIAFPGMETSEDMVREARRPTTRHGRAKR